jgi:hypothetical protein
MKGIREAAMGADEPEYVQKPLLGKDYYGYDPNGTKGYWGEQEDNLYGKSYPITTRKDGEITITLMVPSSKIGSIADYTKPEYNWTAAETRATEIAYDEIENLFAKDYQTKYTMALSAVEGDEEFEVTITLNPIKTI